MDKIKVVIADDEAKVCQLLQSLIQWEALGLELVGVAANGLEALRLTEQQKPDILITDIRMPGCDGLTLIGKLKAEAEDLEIIIISGYRHFDYAHEALSYGVRDYLLKPINQSELSQALERCIEKHRLQCNRLSAAEALRLRLEEEIREKRQRFLQQLQKQAEDTVLEIDQINQIYGYRFAPGLWQLLIIKVDSVEGEDISKSLEILLERIARMALEAVAQLCLDIEYCRTTDEIILLLNYLPEQQSLLRRDIKTLHNELVLLKNFFNGVTFTLAIGPQLDSPQKLTVGILRTRKILQSRLWAGTEQIVEQEPALTQNLPSELWGKYQRSMETAVLQLDQSLARSAVKEIFVFLENQPDPTAFQGYEIAERAYRSFLTLAQKENLLVEDLFDLLGRNRILLQRCHSLTGLEEKLGSILEQNMAEMDEARKQAESRPIRLAKQYLQQNYMRPVTLEEVGRVVGFSTAYFSSFFKKETGENFLEYVLRLRMEKATELLKDTDLSIAAICEQVGYSDLKHFSKNFKSFTGLKPNEYRKLYA